MALVEDIIKEFNAKIQALNQSIISLKKERDLILQNATNPSGMIPPCVVSDIPTPSGLYPVRPEYVGQGPELQGMQDKLALLRCQGLADKDKEIISKIEEKEAIKKQLKNDLEFTLKQLGFSEQEAAQAAVTAYTNANEASEQAEKRKTMLTFAFISLFTFGIILLIILIIKQIKKKKQ